MRRARYSVRGRLAYPIQPNTGGQGTTQPGAVPYESEGIQPRRQVPRSSVEREERVPTPFDHRIIIPAPTSAVQTVLLGDNRNSSGAGIVNSVIVPIGMRGEVTGIFPYLEGATGPVNQPRIPGAQVKALWTIYVNGRPVGDYGNISDIIAPWQSAAADRPLIYMEGGEILTCNISLTDPLGIYQFVGVRIKGRFLATKSGETKT